MSDGEGHALLRKIARNKLEAEAYDKIIPNIYLRNPKMSANVKVPKLNEVETSELLFGSQSVIYLCIRLLLF